MHHDGVDAAQIMPGVDCPRIVHGQPIQQFRINLTFSNESHVGEVKTSANLSSNGRVSVGCNDGPTDTVRNNIVSATKPGPNDMAHAVPPVRAL